MHQTRADLGQEHTRTLNPNYIEGTLLELKLKAEHLINLYGEDALIEYGCECNDTLEIYKIIPISDKEKI